MYQCCNTEDHLNKLNGMHTVYILKYLTESIMDRLRLIYGQENVSRLETDKYFRSNFFLNFFPGPNAAFRYEWGMGTVRTDQTGSWAGLLFSLMAHNYVRLPTLNANGVQEQCSGKCHFFSKPFPQSGLSPVTKDNYTTLGPVKYPEQNIARQSGQNVWSDDLNVYTPFFANPFSPHLLKDLLQRLDVMASIGIPLYTDTGVGRAEVDVDEETYEITLTFEPSFDFTYRAFVMDVGWGFESASICAESGTVSGTIEIDLTDVQYWSYYLVVQPDFPDRFEELFG